MTGRRERDSFPASFCFFARGSAPSGASRQTRLLLPPVGLPGPHPGFLSFHDERNQRRARGAAPGPRWGAIIIPPTAQAPFPPGRGCGTDAEGFATLTQGRNWHFFLPGLHRGNTGYFQTVARGLLAPNVSAVSVLCQVCVREFGFVKPFVGP